MFNLYDIAYATGLALSAPVWLALPKARRKVLAALRQRMGDVDERISNRPAVMIHAVSNGELNATTALIAKLREAKPELEFIVSTTTASGFEQAGKLYGTDRDVRLIRYPLDFTHGILRALSRVKPSLVVLMELEVWPNFLLQCKRRGIPVIVANGRMSVHSHRQYTRAKPLVRSMFRRLTRVCAQDELYAKRFIDVGARPADVVIAGNMKFDTATVSDEVEGAAELAEAVGLRPASEPIWVCGSTGPGEEEMILRVYRELLSRHPALRLVIVPRHKPRFDEVAELITEFTCVRRSMPGHRAFAMNAATPAVVLGDTFGELRKFYSLATVVFVGRSLVDLGSKQHGSDMIEAAALAKPVIVGPWTGNFADAVRKLRHDEALLVVEDEAGLRERVGALLSSPESATALGRRAQEVIRREQGSTERHAEIVLALMDRQIGGTRGH